MATKRRRSRAELHEVLMGRHVVVPQSAAFVRALRRTVPPGALVWRPDGQPDGGGCWWVAEAWAADVEELIVQHFGSVVVTGAAGDYMLDRLGRCEQPRLL